MINRRTSMSVLLGSAGAVAGGVPAVVAATGTAALHKGFVEWREHAVGVDTLRARNKRQTAMRIRVTGARTHYAKRVTFSSIYGGEDYDARADVPGWREGGGGTEDWRAPEILRLDHGSRTLAPERGGADRQNRPPAPARRPHRGNRLRRLQPPRETRLSRAPFPPDKNKLTKSIKWQTRFRDGDLVTQARC